MQNPIEVPQSEGTSYLVLSQKPKNDFEKDIFCEFNSFFYLYFDRF